MSSWKLVIKDLQGHQITVEISNPQVNKVVIRIATLYLGKALCEVFSVN